MSKQGSWVIYLLSDCFVRVDDEQASKVISQMKMSATLYDVTDVGGYSCSFPASSIVMITNDPTVKDVYSDES